MANLNNISEVVNQILDELQKLKKDLQKLEQTSSNPEALAAKIINDITQEIKNCPCNKEILEALTSPSNQSLVPITSQNKEIKEVQPKYKFPNFDVGNPELGSSASKGAMEWPFKKIQ